MMPICTVFKVCCGRVSERAGTARGRRNDKINSCFNRKASPRIAEIFIYGCKRSSLPGLMTTAANKQCHLEKRM